MAEDESSPGEDTTAGPVPEEGSPRRATGGRGWLLAAAVVAVIVQVVGLYAPGSAVPSVPIVGLDKAVHALLFGVPVWLLGRLTGRYFRVALVFVIHAMASEVIQWRYIPNREGDVFDLVADLVGIALALWLLTTPVREVGGTAGPRSPGR